MERAFLQRFATGLLIGAAIGMLTGNFAVWFSVGAGVGVAFAAMGRKKQALAKSDSAAAGRPE